MWATINEDNSIKEIINYPRAITVGQVRHPKDIFKSWSWTDLNNIGIYEVVDSSNRGNDFFEYSTTSYAFNSNTNKVVMSCTLTDKPLADLKAKAIAQAKTTANNYIKRFSWLVERLAYDGSKTIPSAVGTYVGDIKTAVTSTTALHNEDWLALFAERSIPAGTFNERMLGYINGELSTTYTDINVALQAFAVDQEDFNFSSMGTFTP